MVSMLGFFIVIAILRALIYSFCLVRLVITGPLKLGRLLLLLVITGGSLKLWWLLFLLIITGGPLKLGTLLLLVMVTVRSLKLGTLLLLFMVTVGSLKPWRLLLLLVVTGGPLKPGGFFLLLLIITWGSLEPGGFYFLLLLVIARPLSIIRLTLLSVFIIRIPRLVILGWHVPARFFLVLIPIWIGLRAMCRLRLGSIPICRLRLRLGLIPICRLRLRLGPPIIESSTTTTISGFISLIGRGGSGSVCRSMFVYAMGYSCSSIRA